MPTINEKFWMPFTARNGFRKDPRIVAAADGCYLITDDGRKVFDSLSGLWCCGFGHNRPEIADAVSQQLRTLDYSPCFQLGHPQAFAAGRAPGEFSTRTVSACVFYEFRF